MVEQAKAIIKRKTLTLSTAVNVTVNQRISSDLPLLNLHAKASAHTTKTPSKTSAESLILTTSLSIKCTHFMSEERSRTVKALALEITQLFAELQLCGIKLTL